MMHFPSVSATVTLLFSVLAVATPVELQERTVNAGPNPTDPSFQQAVLANHNWFRAIHHAPNLVWDSNLAAWAQYAATTCNFQHTGGPYGENIYGESGNCDNWNACTQRAIVAWANEEKDYNYDNPNALSNTGHFTQVVWKGSTKIGCSWNTAPCSDLRILFCEYSPRGNIAGQYAANVQRP